MVAIPDFGAFYEATFADVYRLVLGIVRDAPLATDITQEAYLSAFQQRASYRGDAPPSHWIMRIAANRAISATRRRRLIRWLPITSQPEAMEPGPDATVAMRLAIEEVLELLPPQQRAAVTLRYVHDFDYATIGQILNTTPNNVGVLLTRGIARIRRHLNEGKSDEG